MVKRKPPTEVSIHFEELTELVLIWATLEGTIGTPEVGNHEYTIKVLPPQNEPDQEPVIFAPKLEVKLVGGDTLVRFA
jgi:hypothetical protein